MSSVDTLCCPQGKCLDVTDFAAYIREVHSCW